MTARSSTINRTTNETSIEITINLDARDRVVRINTGLGFLNHMLDAFARHARIDLVLNCAGDTCVDDHHTVEDCAISLGRAINDAIGERRDIARFGSAFAPLDEALARAVIDLSGRPASVVNLTTTRDNLGDVACENLTHFFQSLATEMKCAMHIDVIRGENNHHKVEAAFKACALACRAAWTVDVDAGVPSTKGTLE